MPFTRTIADYSVYVAVRLAVGALQTLPMSACAGIASFLATLCHRVLKIRRGVVDENLRTAFPDLMPTERDAVAWRMWRHLFLMICEISQTHRKLHRTNYRELCEIPDITSVVRQLISPRPKVVICGHYGNFELGGYVLGLFGFPTHTVARELDNPYLDKFLNDFRGRTGQHMLPKQGSRPAMEKVMADGGILTLLGDQAAGDKAVWTNFFGRPASTHKAVALFTLSFEAPTLVIYARRQGAEPMHYYLGQQGYIDPAAPDFAYGSAPSFIEWFTQRLEEMVRDAPDQYWWLHRRWKGAPPAKREKTASV